MVDTFAEELHPRGADGRFIEKFGIIKFLKNAKWQYGKVSDISKDEHGNISVKVDESDLSGNPTGVSHVLSPKQVYTAPKPTGYLKVSDPKAQKIGPQAGSNPGGLYELPTPPSNEDVSTTGLDGWPNQAKNAAAAYPGQRLLWLKNDQNQVFVEVAPDQWQAYGVGEGMVSGNKYPTSALDINVPVEYWQPPSVSPSSSKWYVKKAKSKNHGRNEDLANALYRALGVPVPEVAYDESDGNIYSKIVDGSVDDMASHVNGKDQGWLDHIKSNFAIDAWLANWDVFGLTYDNVKTAPDGVPYRIDNGGALLYRAQGAAKGKDFGSEVGELTSFREGKKGKVFAGITKEQELDGAQRILALRPDEIRGMVKDHQLPDSLADTLIARRAFIAKHYGLDLPEEVVVEAEPVDIVDLTTSGGKERHWKSASLGSLVGVLSTYDEVEIDGKTYIYGMGVDGVPIGAASKAIQMQKWLSQHGSDKQVWISKGEQPGVPRPDHGASMELSSISGYAWQRGDKFTFDATGQKMEVIEVNNQIGVALLLPEGKDDPILWSLRYDGDKTITVDTWDKKEPVPEPGVEEPLQEWELQLLAPMEPEPTPTVEELQTLLEPVSTGPVTQATAATAAIKADIQVEAQKNVTAGPGTKSMFLGDGTEATVGSKVFSSKDGKTYIYVKKKGPYAVVTDPDSDDPAKPLTKLASTLGQPDKKPTAVPDAGSKDVPKSANGVVPQVGMTATAKDGHSGVITMVSPDGKFVFIQDSAGKKKRKSIGTVTIDSQDAAATVSATPEPVVSTGDDGTTTISIPDPPQVEDVETVKALYPTSAAWWPSSDVTAQGEDWAAKIEPDGSYSMVPVGPGENLGDGYILTPSGQVAGFSVKNAVLPAKPAVIIAAAKDGAGKGQTYKALVNGKWWVVVPNDKHGDLILKDDLTGEFMQVDIDSGNIPVQMTLGDAPYSVPDSIDNFWYIPPSSSYEEFVPLAELGLKKGDLVSPDGTHWLKVDKPFGSFVRLLNDDGDIVYMSAAPGTTVMYKEHVPVVEPVDIPPVGPNDQQTMSNLLDLLKTNDPAGISEAVTTIAAGTAPGHFISIPGKNGEVISGKVVGVDLLPGEGHTPITLHTAEGTKWVDLPNDTPIVIHGDLEGDAPVPLSPKQWAGIGIGEGQYVYPSSTVIGKAVIPHKVLGFGPDGALQLQNGETGEVFSFLTLESMQTMDGLYLHIGKQPSLGYYPPVNKGPDPAKKSHDAMSTKQQKTVWDSLPDTIAKPTNTTVYYDPVSGVFVWQNGDGHMVTVDPVTMKQDIDPSTTDGNEWLAYMSGEQVVVKPVDTEIVTHPTLTTLQFQIIPDHHMVLLSDAVWAVPKGQMKNPEAWVGVFPVGENGMSSTMPNLLIAQTDVSGAVALVNPDDAPEFDAPKVSTGEPKVPDSWPSEAAAVAQANPGKKLLLYPDTEVIYVETQPDYWQWDKTVGDLYGGYTKAELDKAGDNEVWNPEAAVEPTITIHGQQFGESVMVKQKEGSQVYYFQDDPWAGWQILYSDGTTSGVQTEDLDPTTGDPVGKTIWPQNFEPETPPVAKHVMGGESKDFPGMSTEKDDLVAQMVGGNAYPVLKGSQGEGMGVTYFVLRDDIQVVETWFVDEATGVPFQQSGYAINFDNPQAAYQELVDLMPPNFIFTDVTPANYAEPTPDNPAKPWDAVVMDKVNPASLGYGGLAWVDPQTLKGDVPEGWAQGDYEYSLIDYPKAVGPNVKVLMATGTNEDGKKVTKFYTVSASGSVGAMSGGGLLVANADIDPNHNDPVQALKDAAASLGIADFTLTDVSSVNPVNHIIGYKTGHSKNPGNQWTVSISPTWTVFQGYTTTQSDFYYYRDEGGRWWEVSSSGTTTHVADNDKDALDFFATYKVSLVELTMSTDQPIPEKKPANVPGPVNKATAEMVYTFPNGAQVPMSAGDELYTGPGDYVFIKSGSFGKWLYWYNQPNGTAHMETWPEGMDAPPDFVTGGITPVDISTSVPQPSAPTTAPAIPSTKTSPPNAPDPSVLSQPQVPMSTVTPDFPAGKWIAFKESDGSITWYETTGGSGYGVPKALVWTMDANTGVWEQGEDDVHLWPDLHPQVWVADSPAVGQATSTQTPNVPTPQVPVSTVPSAPSYPGSTKPTDADIQSWGGALTKDGHIPTPGMYVKGKGPMHGIVVGISKDKTKITVLADDGKKTTRLISAISVDHTANFKKYGTVVLPKDAPAGQYLSVKSMDEAVAHLLDPSNQLAAAGQTVAIHVGGTRDGHIVMRLAKGPDGKPVIRAYTRLTTDSGNALVTNLTKPVTAPATPELGDWDSKLVPSGDVKIGDGLAMRFGTTTNKWKPDANGEVPTHTVTGIAPGDVPNKITVTLKNNADGTEITSSFYTDPGKSVSVITWDANKPKVVKPLPAGAQQVTAPGWTGQSGMHVSPISKAGVWEPHSGSKINGVYGHNSDTMSYKFNGADGSVIEATLPLPGHGKKSSDGFTAITIPVTGDSVDTSKKIAASLDQLGIGTAPPNQQALKATIARTLMQFNKFDRNTLGKDIPESQVEIVAQKALDDFGLKIGFGIGDLGWQDVMVGTDEGGSLQFYWSDRVLEAIEKKNKNRYLIKTNQTGTAEKIVQQFIQGVHPGPIRVTESGKGGDTPGSDNSKQAAYGGFFSAVQDDKFATVNPFWHGQLSIYAHPMAGLQRLGDVRAAQFDAFGYPHSGDDSAKAMLGMTSKTGKQGFRGTQDIMFEGGLPPEDIMYIGVDSPSEVAKAIQMLKDKGISHVGGRPIEQIVMTRAAIAKLKPSQDMPPYKGRPANAIPITSVPVDTTDLAAKAAESAEAAVVASEVAA